MTQSGQTCLLTQSQYTDTGSTSSSADPITPGAWQGGHCSPTFKVTGMIQSGQRNYIAVCCFSQQSASACQGRICSDNCARCHSFSFRFSSRWHRSARKGPYALRPFSQQSPQGCPRNSANICLVEHRSFSTLEGGMSAASFLHSSFLQANSAVMLLLVRVEKVPQASVHLCAVKLQTRCDICCA